MPDLNVLRTALRQEAVRLLGRREHSRAELSRKLSEGAGRHPALSELPAEEQQVLIEEVLGGLVEAKWQSDTRFAQQRVNQRGARYGNRALAQDLARRGIAETDIAQALSAGNDEMTRCHAVWAKKFGAVSVSRDELPRQIRFLQSRGFSGETIRTVLKSAGETTSPEWLEDHD